MNDDRDTIVGPKTVECIDDFDVVRAQLKAAARAGARIVYGSFRSRQRRKAFRIRWMLRLDEHWIAYPEFIAGALTALERFKLRLCGRPRVRYLGACLPPQDPGASSDPQIFAAVAGALAARGYTTLLVGVGAAAEAGSPGNLRVLPRLPMDQLCELIRSARLIVANGGDTLKTPYRDGMTHIVLEPLDLMARLAALVPKPRMHLRRYHGVFAPHNQHRAAVRPVHRGRGAATALASEADPTKFSTPRHVAES